MCHKHVHVPQTQNDIIEVIGKHIDIILRHIVNIVNTANLYGNLLFDLDPAI